MTPHRPRLNSAASGTAAATCGPSAAAAARGRSLIVTGLCRSSLPILHIRVKTLGLTWCWMGATDSYFADAVLRWSKKAAGLREAAAGSSAFVAEPVARWPGCWDSVADTIASVAEPAVVLAAYSLAYSPCSRSRNCCRIFANRCRYSCIRSHPYRRTCLHLKSWRPQCCRRLWKPRRPCRPATLARIQQFPARSSSAERRQIYFHSTHRIAPTAR